MSDWNKQRRAVETGEVKFCALCGAEIAQLHYSNGQPFWTDVIKDRGQRVVILGAGNHYNFKPHHDCVEQARKELETGERLHSEFVQHYQAALQAINDMNASDEHLKQTGLKVDRQLAEVLQRVRETAETNFKNLESQKQGQEAYIANLRARHEQLRLGKTTIPADKPATGRRAKIVKGLKIPVGTEGTIFWMGLNRYKEDDVRIGIEANGQKFYTSSENIQIIEK